MTNSKKKKEVQPKNGGFRPNVYVAVPLAIILILLIAAFAGSKQGKKDYLKPGTLTIAVKEDPRFLNPVLVSDGNSMFVNSFIFNTLVRYDENFEIQPELAESWEVVDQGRKVRFKLKEGIKWHDGVELTADDCIFTFNKVLDPDTNTFNSGLFKVRGYEIKFTKIDDYTFEAELPEPFAPFFNNLTLVGIVPKHILENEDINHASFNYKPIGTGPFVFEEWKSAEKLVLKANPGYFKGAPKLDQIDFQIVPSNDGKRIALLTRQVDAASLAPEDLFIIKDETPDFVKIYTWDDLTYYYYGFDLTNPIFADVKVRKAINYAIDTENICQSLLHGYGSPVNGPIPRASWAYTDDVVKYPYSPDKARQLLDEAGWKKGAGGFRYKDGKKLTFTISYVSGSSLLQGASIYLQNYLREVGIDAKLKGYDYGALINSLYPGKFESVVFDWIETPDPDIYTEWHSSQMGDVGMNFMSYSNEKLDFELEGARSEMNRSERKGRYERIQKAISEDAPYVFLWNSMGTFGVNKRVKGLSKPTPLGLFTEPEKVWIENCKIKTGGI